MRRPDHPASAAGPFAAALVTALLAVLLAAPGRAAGPFDLEFALVVEGVTLAFRPGVTRYPVIGNAVLIDTGDGVVLVDGGGGAAVADQILARIAAMGAGPLRFVLVTHWHSDHTVGLDRYLAAYPGARIVSHPWTRERIAGRLVERVERFPERLEALRELSERELASGRDEATGEPLSTVAREYRRQLLDDHPVLARHAARASAGVPGLTAAGGLTLHLGERPVEVLFVGRANTPGDLAAYLPRERVLIAGDIVTHPVPFGYPTYPSEVIDAIERLLEIDFDHLVPGHGPVQRDRAHAERLLALQRHAVAEIRRLADEGLDEAAIHERLDLAPFDRAIVGGDERVAYFFDLWYRRPIVGRVLAESGR